MSFGWEGGPSVSIGAAINRMYGRGDMLFVASAGNEQLVKPGGFEYPACERRRRRRPPAVLADSAWSLTHTVCPPFPSSSPPRSRLPLPAAYDAVISVAAVDCNATVAPFSTRNSQVELAAPGVSVRSTTMPVTLPESSLWVSRPGTPFKTRVASNAVGGSGVGRVAAEVVYCGLAMSRCRNATGKVRPPDPYPDGAPPTRTRCCCSHARAMPGVRLAPCRAVPRAHRAAPGCRAAADLPGQSRHEHVWVQAA